MPDNSPALAFERVTKTYGSTIAVDAVSLAIAGGSFVALVGTSGSGKSTLLKTINRLVEPSEGRVTIDGADVAAEPAPNLRRRIGYVFQNIGLFPHMTIAENIAIGLRIAGRKDAVRDGAKVGELLDLVDLPRDIAERMPEALSGGQRQRVGIARALAPGAKLLLLDEAFGALDPVTRDALGTRIRELHDRLGLTTILVTHDMAEALLLADRVLVMKAGRIVADATPAELVAGKGGDDAQALVRVPRAQAERLQALVS
ncbi:osmoprotectant transport system ATP-binding protein [Sphingomonas sp. PP-F2F-A104-K0414]|uniref:ATP-binding cassette domain-containing protein n=1 Tax=Sphingomonas sp. PP-F2F-A104-K0414 TaxID=2135661 RepID=UPI0010465817|nr:ABC transporter ATP-binding protein [Sphingomonas sp. PP-F2F-A104-K0414]TCQ01204.1 osmoprotectant transport system ATP-binding protein [Sphingomonas sp. PP-F2F-A104-K0414]